MIKSIFGDPKKSKIDKDLEYFKERNILLDCRGYIEIHKEANFGFNICIYTMSHDIHDYSKCHYRPVRIKKGAWIGSNVVLYNCTIGEGAIVACGTVVRSRDVPPGTLVEGNPPKIIAEKDPVNNEWNYYRHTYDLERKK